MRPISGAESHNIDTDEGWLYLKTVEDMWSRRMVGHAITDDLRAMAVLDAMEMALGRRIVVPVLIFHSDRGTQYTNHRLRWIFTAHGIVQSMSSSNCNDNAMAESFCATFKKGHVFWERFRTKEEALRRIFEYLRVFYNRVRRHSSLGCKSLVTFEQQHQMLACFCVHKTG
jgi:putative transposase